MLTMFWDAGMHRLILYASGDSTLGWAEINTLTAGSHGID